MKEAGGRKYSRAHTKEDSISLSTAISFLSRFPMPPVATQGRKRYLLPTPDRSKPSTRSPPTQDLSALKLDPGYKGCGVLRTTREGDGRKEGELDNLFSAPPLFFPLGPIYIYLE